MNKKEIVLNKKLFIIYAVMASIILAFIMTMFLKEILVSWFESDIPVKYTVWLYVYNFISTIVIIFAPVIATIAAQNFDKKKKTHKF